MSGILHPELPIRPVAPGTGTIPRDPTLPSLAGALDPEGMAARFRFLGAGLGDIESVGISYVRYKPGLSCVIQYRVRNGTGERVFHGRLCPDGGFHSLADKARATLRPLATGEPSVHLLPELKMILSAFPHDRSVKGMRHILETHKLKRILHRVADRYDPARRWVSGTHSRVHVVTYKPERRCLVRCDLGVRNRQSGKIERETIFARIYADDRGRRVSDLHKDLVNERGFGPRGAPVPEPVGYDPVHRILFFDAVPGIPLTDRCGSRRLPSWLETTGRFLAHLHRSGHRSKRSHDPGTYLEEADRTVAQLSGAGVAESPTLQEAIRKLQSTRPPRENEVTACLHGDFHPGQILVTGRSLYCIDFDETGVGDPGLDLGYFTAHLRKWILTDRLEPGSLEECTNAFLRGYRAAGGKLPPAEVLNWHRNLTFLRQALNSIKHLENGWRDHVRFYLEGIDR